MNTAAVPSAGFAPPAEHFDANALVEATVLGAVMHTPGLLASLDFLEVDDFAEFKHKSIFLAIRTLEAKGKLVDALAIQLELARTERIDAVGANYVELVDTYGYNPTLATEYAGKLRNRRRNILLLQKLGAALVHAQGVTQRDHDSDVSELLDETIGDLQRLRANHGTNGRVRLITIPQALAEGEALAAAPIFTTPFPTLNQHIGFGGFLGTQVYTIAAGTGRGKTSLIACIAGHAVEHDNVPVLVATWEMKPIYFVARRAAGLIGCHSNDILRGVVPFRTVNAAMPYGRFFFLHRPTLEQLRRAAVELAQRFGQAPLIFADYLQKLAAFIARTSQQRPDLRMATSEASDALVEIADESRGAVIAVSSVGRGKGKILETPRKFDPYSLVEVAKESGDVEYDGAGLIVITHEKQLDGEEQVATMSVAKARFGRGVHVDMRYDGARGIWRDVGAVDALAPPVTSSASTDKIRRRIADALREAGAIVSKDSVARAAKIQATAARPEIDAMVDGGEIEKSKTGYRLTDLGKANYAGRVE